MQKYGQIVHGELVISAVMLSGYKPIEYAEIPEDFDQMTQAVYQGDITEYDDKIFVGIEIKDVEVEDDGDQDVF